jgi:hypothetical protein
VVICPFWVGFAVGLGFSGVLRRRVVL